MGANEGILRDLLGILLVAQELVGHRVDAIPIAGYQLVECRGIAALKAVDQQAVQSYFLGFSSHMLWPILIRKFEDCSHESFCAASLEQQNRDGQCRGYDASEDSQIKLAMPRWRKTIPIPR